MRRNLEKLRMISGGQKISTNKLPVRHIGNRKLSRMKGVFSIGVSQPVGREDFSCGPQIYSAIL